MGVCSPLTAIFATPSSSDIVAPRFAIAIPDIVSLCETGGKKKRIGARPSGGAAGQDDMGSAKNVNAGCLVCAKQRHGKTVPARPPGGAVRSWRVESTL